MNRQKLVIVLLVIFFAGFAVKIVFRSTPQKNALHARELATRRLAEAIVRYQSGERVLVISNPFTQRKGTEPGIAATEEAGIRGLRLGLNTIQVAYPELKPGAMENPRAFIPVPDATTPLSFLVAPEAFDSLARKHADCKIIVSLIGLPAELEKCQAWTVGGTPRFALLFPDLRMIGDAGALQKAVKSGKLLAFVMRKPGGVDDSAPMGKDLKTEFDKRFVLVASETIDEVIRTYPQLF